MHTYLFENFVGWSRYLKYVVICYGIFKVICVSIDSVTQVTHHAWEKVWSLVNVDNLWKSSCSDVFILRVYMQYNYLYDFYKGFGVIHKNNQYILSGLKLDLTHYGIGF